MSYIKEKVAYLRGLAEGIDISDSQQGKLFNAIITAMDAMADAVEENEAAITEIDECIDDIYDDLDGIDEYLFDDDDDEIEFDEDDFIEMECPSCGETVFFDAEMVNSGEDLICPGCNVVMVPSNEQID